MERVEKLFYTIFNMFRYNRVGLVDFKSYVVGNKMNVFGLVKIYVKFKIWTFTKEGRVTMGKIFGFLNGKKTYLGAVAYAIWSIVQFAQDQNAETLMSNLFKAYLIWCGRSAISKVETK